MKTIYRVYISRTIDGLPPHTKHFESKILADDYFHMMKILLPGRHVYGATVEYYGGENLFRRETK